MGSNETPLWISLKATLRQCTLATRLRLSSAEIYARPSIGKRLAWSFIGCFGGVMKRS
jgi:hypothetical protein